MKRIFWCVFIGGICLFIINFYFNQTNFTIYENKNNVNSNNNFISMMIETGANSGVYEESKDSLWPTTDYTFNSNLSKCENGSTLTWDNTTRKVVMKGNVSDKCYVYFDVVPPILLADHIKSKYTSQGANGLYYHDSTLANGAGDNSYRYAGANPNNYVCFGSTTKPCPADNLYRIIGVFEDQVKLIKYDYANSNLLGTDGGYSSYTYSANDYSSYKGQHMIINKYYWTNGNVNYWNESRLNTINLNVNFLNKFDLATKNKIATTTWKVGGNTYANVASATAPNAYKNEIVTPAESTTYNAKIGLMYVSDYGFAADPSTWTTTLYNYDTNNISSKNWMLMGLNEWTISRSSDNIRESFNIYDLGSVGRGKVTMDAVAAARPVFYLTSSTLYNSGDGTQEDPIRIVI